MHEIAIRPVTQKDDALIASVIRESLMEYDAPAEGSALGDLEVDFMSSAYSDARSSYFLAESEGKILGGAGVAQLENADPGICELRKMYLSKDSRGKGIGWLLMQACLDKAKSLGFRYCYLETFPTMKDAQKLYVRTGFQYLDKPMGGTGHGACTVWMLKNLSDAD